MLLSGPQKEGDSGLMATDSVRDGDNNNNTAPLDGGTDCVCVRVCLVRVEEERTAAKIFFYFLKRERLKFSFEDFNQK